MRVAAVQTPDLSLREGGGESQLQSRLDYIRTVLSKECLESDLAVFPELFLSGYAGGVWRRCSFPQEDVASQVAQIAKDHAVALCVPYAEQAGRDIYNAAVLVDRKGNVLHNYRKTHLFSDTEKTVFTAGSASDLKVVSLQYDDSGASMAVGMLICMDVEYPEPARVLALQGAQLLCIPTALGRGPVSRVTPTAVVPARALENHVFIVYSNHQHSEHDLQDLIDRGSPWYCGRSAVVAPNGVPLASAPDTEDAPLEDAYVCHAVCDPMHYEADVERNPYLRDRRPELYAALSAPHQ